ncbi:MAG: N-acetylmuramoyl-L-alanine amidase [Nanoarchaeota archaeon]|nr:N-acetylmuramoyl-L-alanine amidase [Nanoarchaeota archaeon]
MGSKKRGFIIYSILKVAIGVGFALLLLWYAVEKGKGLDFERVYLSKDIALTINGIYGMPADVLLDYENGYMEQFERKYDIAAGNSIVEVSVHDASHLSATYPYGEVLTRRVDSFLEEPNYLAFVLRSGKITMTKSREAIAQMGCPSLYTGAEINQVTLLFEPGETQGEGNKEGDLEEYIITKQIADVIRILCTAQGLNCRIVQQQDIDAKLTEIQSTQKDLLVSIHIGSTDASRNPAAIRYITGDQRSEKLACLLSNLLIEDFKPVEIKKVEPTTSDKKLQVLKGVSPAVSIELSNLKKTSYITDPDKIAMMASSILNSIKAYYGPGLEEPEPSAPDVLPGSNAQP